MQKDAKLCSELRNTETCHKPTLCRNWQARQEMPWETLVGTMFVPFWHVPKGRVPLHLRKAGAAQPAVATGAAIVSPSPCVARCVACRGISCHLLAMARLYLMLISGGRSFRCADWDDCLLLSTFFYILKKILRSRVMWKRASWMNCKCLLVVFWRAPCHHINPYLHIIHIYIYIHILSWIIQYHIPSTWSCFHLPRIVPPGGPIWWDSPRPADLIGWAKAGCPTAEKPGKKRKADEEGEAWSSVPAVPAVLALTTGLVIESLMVIVNIITNYYSYW